MLSKEEKLQYGEILRMQMREKDERKKLEDLEKRGARMQQHVQPIPQAPPVVVQRQYVQPIQQHPQPQYQPIEPPLRDVQYKENAGGLLDKKELLQKKLEMEEYNPFGRGGAGAPMKDYRGDVITHRKPVISQQQYTAGNYQQEQYAVSPPNGYANYPSSQQLIPQSSSQYMEAPPQPYSAQIQQQPQYQAPAPQPQYSYQPAPPQPSLRTDQSQPFFSADQQHGQQLQEVYKHGARNLLQLQNTDQAELNLKQRQKLEMQRVLKEQMEEAQRRKKEEKERIKREEFEHQQREKRYLEEKNRQKEEEDRKKNEAEARVREINEKNRQLTLEEQNKKKKLIDMPPIVLPKEQEPAYQPVPQEQFYQQKQVQAVPEVDYHEIEEAFNTDISRDFIKREKQIDPQRKKRDKHLEEVKHQIERMREELNNQGELYKLELEKMKLQAERAKYDKQRADNQLHQLKEQLRKKIQQDNNRLNDALAKNDPAYYQPSPRQPAKRRPQPIDPIVPLRASNNEVLIDRKYKIEDNSSGNFDQGLQSLVGQTKKIPVNLKNNDNLTMSRIEDYAVDSRFFHKKSSHNVVQPRSDVIYEQEQDENYNAVPKDFKYRPKSRPKVSSLYENQFSEGDELDKFVHNQNSKGKDVGKWSKNMNSVDSEINREIQRLLQDQRRVPTSMANVQQQRPASKLSNAGRNSIAGNDKYGYAAEGFTLKSDGPGTLQAYGTRNSFDLDNINQKNDRRLDRLRELGISSVGGDEELNKLDVMLNKYNR